MSVAGIGADLSRNTVLPRLAFWFFAARVPPGGESPCAVGGAG